MYRIEWLPEDWKAANRHFRRAGAQETAAFALLRYGRSASGIRMSVIEFMPPPDGGVEHAANDFLRPSGRWLSAAVGMAVELDCGLAFIHSHPGTDHPASLSEIDQFTSRSWSRMIVPTIRNPFASLVWSPRGLAGVVFLPADAEKAIIIDRCEVVGDGSIQIVDRRLLQSTVASRLDDRQNRALTELGNRLLSTLHVGVVGVGGTGSPLAEQLVRAGVAHLLLVDPDVLDEPSNLRRVVGSRKEDIDARRRKVDVVGEHLDSFGLSTSVEVAADDVRTDTSVRRLLDCDVVLSTTDTQSSRALVNQVAMQYWLPVIDVGVRVGAKLDGSISGMPAEVRVLLPDSGCLWCRRVLSSQIIYEENLPPDARERLAEEGYIQGSPAVAPSIISLNYFAAALAALTMIRLYSGQRLPYASVVVDPWLQITQPLPSAVAPDCICARWRGLGDSVALSTLPGRVGV